MNRVMPKDNIALAAVFRTVVPNSGKLLRKVKNLRFIDEELGEKVVVCNAHMHWDPEYSDVKMIQSFLLTTELDRIIRLHNRQPHEMPGTKINTDRFRVSVTRHLSRFF